MKTTLQSLLVILLMTQFSMNASAQRYLTEVFTSVNITTNVTYGQNYSFFPDYQNPQLIPLEMDVYEPMNDPLAIRPLIIIIHTGSYFPVCFNGTPAGTRNDSATVEMCRQFARRGYVVANIEYRIGWNPQSTIQDVRRGTLFQAVYRSIQDAKCAVRYFRKDYATSNIYRIDTSQIILGGQGTGGYIALNYISLDKHSELTNPKFISGTDQPYYNFVAGEPFIDTLYLGNFDGYGGNPLWNFSANSTGYSNNVAFAFNLGGALGDSTWIEPGDVPTVSFHVLGDPYAPFGAGIVYVQGNPPMAVVDVAGSGLVSQFANLYGNNSCYAQIPFTDSYTQAANLLNNGNEGLFPFATVPAVQSGPWEWWDSLAVVTMCNSFGTNGVDVYQNGMMTNPNMSKQKALAYIDTVMNYLCPRMVACFPVGIQEEQDISSMITLGPNPGSGWFNINLNQPDNAIRSVALMDATGKVVQKVVPHESQQITIQASHLAPGMYIVKIQTENGFGYKKWVHQ